MTAESFIKSTLDELTKSTAARQFVRSKADLINGIFGILTSKKFRKYSLTPDYAEHIRNAISENVQANAPINVTFGGGSYKLWRLHESPRADWAELFSHIYFSRWVKPICAMYQPGVWFDFFLDDLIIPKINNVSNQSVTIYRNSRESLQRFLKPMLPSNLQFTITGVSSLFGSHDTFNTMLDASIQKLAAELPNGLPVLNDEQKARISLNVKSTVKQLKDTEWREKVELIHSAYLKMRDATGYSIASNKIRAFTQPYPNGQCIAIGSTKDSIVKFWVGVGALKPRLEQFRQIILSPKQIASAQFEWQDIRVPGLNGTNFQKIRVLKV